MEEGVARDSGWGLLLGRKEGLVTLGKGPVGMREEKRAVVKGGVGRVVWGHGGPRSSSKTPPYQQTPQESTWQDARATSAGTIPYPNTFFPSLKTAHGEPRLREQSPSPGAAPSLPGLLVRGQRLLRGRLRQSPATAKPPRPAADGHHGGL